MDGKATVRGPKGGMITLSVVGHEFLATITDIDRPEPRLLVLAQAVDPKDPMAGGGEYWIVLYLAPDEAGTSWDKPFISDFVTPLRDFGVEAELADGFLDGPKLYCHKRGPSRAKYKGGDPREWQAPTGAHTLVRHELHRRIMLAIANDQRAEYEEASRRGF